MIRTPITSARLRNLKITIEAELRIQYIKQIVALIYDSVIETATRSLKYTRYEYLIPTDPRSRHQDVLDFTDENIADIIEGLEVVFPDSIVRLIKKKDDPYSILVDWT